MKNFPSPANWPLSKQYALAIGSVLLAVLIRWLLNSYLGNRIPYLLVFMALLCLIRLVGPGPFIVCGLLGGLTSWYLFIAPGFQWTEVGSLPWLQTFLFFLSIAVGGLTSWLSKRNQDKLHNAYLEAEQQKELLRVTLASIGDAVITTDAKGRIIFLNDVAQQLTGWSLEQATVRPLNKVFHIINENTRQVAENPVDKVMLHGQIVGLANHTLLIDKNGKEYAIDDSAAPIKNPQGEILGVVLVFRDITQRRSADQALQRSEKELSEFFENASVGLHWVGPDGIIIRANQAELDLLGYSREEYVGQPIAKFHADKDVINHILNCLNNGQTLNKYASRLICKDGSIKDVLISSNVFFDNGKFIHTRCITLDVTDLKRAELALRESEQRFRLMANAAPVLIWMSDKNKVCTWFNKTWLDFVGRSLEQEIEEGWKENIHPDDLSMCSNTYLSAFDKRLKFSMEFRLRRHDGAYRWILDHGIPRLDPNGAFAGYIGSCVDITVRVEAEEVLRKADKRKDDFLATLAHELRNPLAPIRNALAVARQSDHDVVLRHQTLAMMERQLVHLVRLVDDLLDVSRISRDRLELRLTQVELTSLIEQAVENTLAGDQPRKLTIKLPDRPIYLNADPIRLTQVFSNLLGNSFKYTEPGNEIWLTAQERDDEILISVKDNGIGIAPDMLSKIFDMFAQIDESLERSQGGLGIGLTLVRRLVVMHHGTVSAFSEGEGKGSEFIVRLPILKEHQCLHAPSIKTTSLPIPKLSILIVDDSQDAALSLQTLLKLSGHTTYVAYDGLEALEKAAASQPQVILLDIGLPKLNGYEVVRTLRKNDWGRQMIIVALTGWGQENDRHRSSESGFDAHIVKPVDYGLLMNLLKELYEAHKFSEEAVRNN